MIVSGFTGGEAEELRRALGFKRSEARMREIEVKLREGMRRNGITGATQDTIVQSITSFAQYGFPESHAASFALIAYASAWLKCHYLAAFTAAILNNQPMGFYSPAVLIKDAQRHGLRIRPADVTRSEWECTVEKEGGARVLRLGLSYVKGLRAEAGRAIVAERRRRPFSGIDDLAHRVPLLRKDELRKLAEAGALNFIGGVHRRDALWIAESAARPAGPLLAGAEDPDRPSPLAPMTAEERLSADYGGTGLTIGPHPMAHCRERMHEMGVSPAASLSGIPNGALVRIAGCVIVRQRPGTAKGFLFLSLEDETGVSNAIVLPGLFERYRLELLTQPFLMVEGVLQNADGAISVKARRVEGLPQALAAAPSHDFR